VSDAKPYTTEAFEPRKNLLLAAWLTRRFPERDYLLGTVLCTTSRWLIFGDTGVGKTLLAADIGGAVASANPLLGWGGRRWAGVMYLDGELPRETFKERMHLIADRYGKDIFFYGYNRDDLGESQMPPLNTEGGEKWLMKEIEALKPDLIIFDSVMSLLIGSMAEEESWEPVKHLMRRISSRRSAQIWLHHTGHDTSKSFGTKTRTPSSRSFPSPMTTDRS
jgi:RecA-family ATPase